MKLFKKLLCLICTVALLFQAVPTVLAQGSPTLEFSYMNLTVGGSSAYIYLYMNNAENISAMDYIITYDADNLELVGCYESWSTNQSDVTISINSDEPGIIHVTLISQNGLNGYCSLNEMSFKAKSTAKAGEYPINVLVNDMYNSNLETVEASTTAGTINVRKATQAVKNVYLYNSDITHTAKVGQSVVYTISVGESKGLSAGTFDFTYDDSMLKIEEVTLSSALENTVNDINTGRPGLVKVSFASTSAINSYTQLITLKFSAIAQGKARISYKPSDLYDSEFVGMTGSESSGVVTIEEPEVVIDYPDLKFLIPENVPSDKEFSVQAILEGGSGVRAGDFAVEYHTNRLECLGVTGETISGAWLSIDQNYSEGTVRFSLMSNVDLTEDTALVTIRFKSTENIDTTAYLTPSGTGTYNADFEKVNLEYKQVSFAVNRPEYTVNFYDSDGITLIESKKVFSGDKAFPPEATQIKKQDKQNHLKFSGWDKDYSVITENTDIVAVYEPEEHTAITQSGVEATCTKTGLTEGKYCVVCDTVTVEQEVVPEKGHTEVETPEKNPGVSRPGYKGGTHCDVCGNIIVEAEEVPPTGPIVSARLDAYGILTINGVLADVISTAGKTIMTVYDGTGRMMRTEDITELNQTGFEFKISNCYDAGFIKIVRWDMASIKPLGSDVKVTVIKNGSINASLKDGVLTVSGALNGDPETNEGIYLAVYSGRGQMLTLEDITSFDWSDFSISIENMEDAKMVKILKWNASNLKPLYNAAVCQVY